MGNLILNSLEIRNFRGFRHLQIERLGRVNLIVGKNNVGKSSLLEALQLYARRGHPQLIWNLLDAHDESKYPVNVQGVRDEGESSASGRSGDIEDRLVALKYLFYGRKEVRAQTECIQIGPGNSPDETLSLAVGWYAEELDEQGRRRRRLLEPEEYAAIGNPVPGFIIQIGEQTKIANPLAPRLVRPEIKEIDYVFIGANGLSRLQAANLWDKISLKDIETDVLAALRIIAPGVEGQSFVGDLGSRVGRIPIVRIVDIDEPLPLRSLGDGMLRMLGITLALANAKDGMLLIDEVENGIHYSVQPELWRLIFQLAHRLNVQVFATTHNWDCIEGFQKAAQDDKEEEGLLIRLSLNKDEIVATLFDERKLGIATREQIEVR